MVIRWIDVPSRLPILLGWSLGKWLRWYVDMRVPVRLPGVTPGGIHNGLSRVTDGDMWFVKERGRGGKDHVKVHYL
jgi:hypothetical protein